MKCIESCVRNTAGAENFENNRAKRSTAREKYLKAKQLYGKRISELSAEYDEQLYYKVKLKVETLKVVMIHLINKQIMISL